MYSLIQPKQPPTRSHPRRWKCNILEDTTCIYRSGVTWHVQYLTNAQEPKISTIDLLLRHFLCPIKIIKWHLINQQHHLLTIVENKNSMNNFIQYWSSSWISDSVPCSGTSVRTTIIMFGIFKIIKNHNIVKKKSWLFIVYFFIIT